MDKKKQMQFNLNNFLLSTSSLFDKQEKNCFDTQEFHSKKMAYVALKLAQGFEFSKEQLNDLCSYCLCHNVAIKHFKDDSKEQFEKAEELIKDLPFLGEEKNILKYQREYYNASGPYALKADDIPLFSQIISFIDTLDRTFDLSKPQIENRKKIISYVEENYGVLFSPLLCDIFLALGEQIDFWCELQNENEMVYFIYASLADFTKELDFEQVLKLCSSYFDSNKELLITASKIADLHKFEHKDKQQFLIAASLCNIGKIAIKDEILNKKSTLSEDEWQELYAYPFYAKRVLNNILGFKDISSFVIKIQESLDYEGYPYNLGAKDLSFKDRLLSILHKYVALREEKNYRMAFSHKESIELLKSDKFKDKIDYSIIEDFNKLV